MRARREHPHVWAATIVFLLSLFLLVWSCSDPPCQPTDPACTNDADVSGTWDGSGSDNIGAGTATLVLDQSGTTVTGTFTININETGQTPTGAVSGSVSLRTFTAHLSGDHDGCAYNLDFEATVNDANTSMSGTYHGTDACNGPFSNGHFTLTKRSAPPSDTTFAVQVEGGEFRLLGDAVILHFPAGALSGRTQITVGPATGFPADQALVGNTVYYFRPDGTAFGQPVQLTIIYAPGDVPSGISESSLRLVKATATGWVEVEGSSVSVSAKAVTGAISGFSDYGIRGARPLQGCTTTGSTLVWPICADDRMAVGQDYGQYNWGSENRYHTGLDIGTERGTTVVVAGSAFGDEDPKVIEIQENDLTCNRQVAPCGDHGYGNTVIVQHAANFLYTHYSHLATIDEALKTACGPANAAGRRVCNPPVSIHSGDPLGTVGCTRYGLSDCGTDFGPHLHFETKRFPTLGTAGGDYGYTGNDTKGPTQQPDRSGYYDPVIWLHQAGPQIPDPSVFPEAEVRVTAQGAGAGLRIGPANYRALRTVLAGERFIAFRMSEATISPACSGGWYQVRPTGGSEFADPSRGTSTIPEAWMCTGNAGEQWLAAEGAPVIGLSRETVGFSADAGGGNPSDQTVQVSNVGGGELTGLVLDLPRYDAGQPTGWLSATLNRTTAPATVTLEVTTGTLAAGNYTARLPVTASRLGVLPHDLIVTFEVRPKSGLRLSSNTIQFSAIEGGGDPDPQGVEVTSTGSTEVGGLAGTISYRSGEPTGWLTASLGTTTPTSMTLAAITGTLAGGDYHATVTVTGSGVDPKPVEVTFSILRRRILAVSPDNIRFSAAVGGGNPADQDVAVTAQAAGPISELAATISYTAGQPTGWLTASLASTTTPATLTLSAATGSLAQGTYTATVTVTGLLADPASVTVSFTLGDGPTVNLTGTWIYQTGTLTGNGGSLVCTVLPTGDLRITQTGTSLAGDHDMILIDCINNIEQHGSASLDPGPILNGSTTPNADQISFDLNSETWHSTGAMIPAGAPNLMGGTVTAQLDLGSPLGVVTVAGDWEAIR